jgi:hypothetical protein
MIDKPDNTEADHFVAPQQRKLMPIRAGGVRVAYPLFQEEGDGSKPISALSLTFHPCPMKRAQGLNRAWHSVLPKTNLGNLTRNRRYVAYTAESSGVFYAVAIWTDPVAANRLTHGDRLLELRRMAIANDAPANTASRMIGWMRREIKRRWPELVGLVSYQDTSAHAGTIYKASGWKCVDTSASLTKWSVNGRIRTEEQSTAPKVRWEWKYDALDGR